VDRDDLPTTTATAPVDGDHGFRVGPAAEPGRDGAGPGARRAGSGERHAPAERPVSAPPRVGPVRAGEPLPDFSGRTSSGATVSRRDLLGHPAVLFFYPKAGSPGCSIESREFARLHEQFAAAGVRVVGISVDSLSAQARFRETCELPFELVGDAEGEIGRRFGVLGALGMARRTTFLVDAEGRIVEVIRTWRPRRHAEAALERLGRSAARSRAGPGGPDP